MGELPINAGFLLPEKDKTCHVPLSLVLFFDKRDVPARHGNYAIVLKGLQLAT